MQRYKIVNLALIIMSLMGLLSCRHDSDPDPSAGPGDVHLRLSLFINSGEAGTQKSGVSDMPTGTRAEDWYYELPDNQWESLNTLRVIIVRPEADNEVEHNRLISFSNVDLKNYMFGEGDDNFVFKVVGGEKKKIYLIANEESLPSETVSALKNIYEGGELNIDLEKIQISVGNDNVFIDNNGASKKYVPITESFEHTVKEAVVGETNEDSATFFITRTATKFSFSADCTANLRKRGFKITSIKISNLSDRQWLFPSEDTQYNPEKYTPSAEPFAGRIITGFSMPDGVKKYEYTFYPKNFGIPGTAMPEDITATYEPLTYLLESDAKEYEVTVTTEIDEISRIYGPVKLPNLALLPRNTHVVIKLSFKGEEMACELMLAPYTGITLDVEYGFDFIVKPPKPLEPDFPGARD